MSFWTELAIYNPSKWIEFAFESWKKSIWFIIQLFRALNATVHKFAVHPVYSEAIQYIVENQTRMQDYDSLKQKANTISIHSWLTTPFLHVIKAEKTGRGINFRFEKDFLPTFFVKWITNFHFIKCRCVQFGYFIDNKEGISITVKNYR